MLSKKQNDFLYLKNKLEALDSLPETLATDKNALWDKLNNRLQQKPAVNKAVWYWLAAGIMPLAIIILTMVNKKENILVKHEKRKSSYVNPAFLQTSAKESVTVYTKALVKKIQPVAELKTKIKNKLPADTDTANEAIATITALPERPKTEVITNSLLTADTSVVFATTIVKKKLQVVHINELETFSAPFTAPINYAQSIKPRKSKTNNLSIATQQNIIGFKIKLSSKN